MQEISRQQTAQTTPKTPKLVNTYVEMYETFEGKDKLSRHEYRLILKYFNNILKRSILYDGVAYNLPYGIGIIGVSSSQPLRPSSKPMDFQHYKETGEKRFIMNLNTDGRILKIVLVPKRNRLYFNLDTRRIYRFKANRSSMRELAKIIKSGQSVYKYHSYETYFN